MCCANYSFKNLYVNKERKTKQKEEVKGKKSRVRSQGKEVKKEVKEKKSRVK